MTRKFLFLAVSLMMIGGFTAAYAGQCEICAKASGSNTNWPERSFCQLAQGSANLLFGWTHAFTEPVCENKCSKHPCPVNKTANGLLKGWGKAVITSGEGLMEALTFWTPVRIVPDSGCVGCCEKKVDCAKSDNSGCSSNGVSACGAPKV